MPVDSLSVGEEEARVGPLVEFCPITFSAEIGVTEGTFAVRIATRTEKVDFIELVVAVIACITVETGIYAVNQQSAIGYMRVKQVAVVAVFDAEILVVGKLNHIGILAVAFP